MLKITTQKLNKTSLLYLAIVILAFIISVGLIWYFSRMPAPIIIKEEKPKPAEKTMEEIIKDLTVPQEKSEPLEEKVIQELTAPEKQKKPVPLSEEIIKNLTTPK